MTRWRSLAARLCGGLAAAALAGMMMLTVTDVLLRSFFNIPIRGTLELVELLLEGLSLGTELLLARLELGGREPLAAVLVLGLGGGGGIAHRGFDRGEAAEDHLVGGVGGDGHLVEHVFGEDGERIGCDDGGLRGGVYGAGVGECDPLDHAVKQPKGGRRATEGNLGIQLDQ